MLLACAFLAALSLAVFSPLFKASFVPYDDPVYVTENARVQQGITWDNVRWAFTTTYFGFYYPLTWLSHMVDCQLYGLQAWGHHLTSVLIHVANALLLLIFLRRTTGAFWRSLAVAALFALHPLHVESVAWISERKDVLATFFLMLSFLAYRRYVLKPGPARYAAVFVLLTAGLMAKSMLVTAPVLLLLLDVWPLQRLSEGAETSGAGGERVRRWQALLRSWQPLLVEKIPLFVLCLCFGILTLFTQREANALAPVAAIPYWIRAENAVVGYATYIVKTVVPRGLAVLYPIPHRGWPPGEVAVSALLLVAVTALVWRLRRGRTYLTVGWLWFLVAIAPVSGILQAGRQAYADRYTYVALIGVFVMVVWGLAEAALRFKIARAGSVWAAAAIVTISMGATTWHQCGYWQNGIKLFSHSLEAGGIDDDTLTALGLSLAEAGRAQDAIPYFKQVTVLNGRSISAFYNLGNAFLDVGKLEPAEACYRRVLQLSPDDTRALHSLGDVQERMGRLADALESYRRQAELQPQSGAAQIDVGRLYAQTGRMDDAIVVFRRAVRLAPGDPRGHYYLALALSRVGRDSEASSEMRAALEAARRAGDRALVQKIEARTAPSGTPPSGSGRSAPPSP